MTLGKHKMSICDLMKTTTSLCPVSWNRAAKLFIFTHRSRGRGEDLQLAYLLLWLD